MISILPYLIKTTLVSAMFFLVYYVALRRLSFFKLNRFYLLGSLIFAYTFPFVHIQLEIPRQEVWTIVPNLQESVNQFTFIEEIAFNESNTLNHSSVNWTMWILGLVSAILIFRFILHLYQLIKTIRIYEKLNFKQYILVLFNHQNTFSFFRYIFISQNVWNSSQNQKIIEHELSHIKHKHSIDRVLMELMLILFWMNPILYLYRKAIEEVHEYQADNDAINLNSSKHDYFNVVMQQASQQNYSPLMSPFSYKLIKKRIKMSTHKSNPIKKALIIIPITLALVILSTSAVEIIQNNILERNPYLLNENITKSSNSFILPIAESKTKKVIGWGYRIHPIYKVKKFHYGIDLIAPLNTPVYASQNGTVSKVTNDKNGYGKRIEIIHKEGYTTLYGHLNDFNTTLGQDVNQGDIIGYVGTSGQASGPHLHFEVHLDSQKINPVTVLPKTTFDSKNSIESDQKSKFILPINKGEQYEISSHYGMRMHPIKKKKTMHRGIDYKAELNTKVVAIAAGTIRKVQLYHEEGKGYGKFIIIDHDNGFSSLYAQLNDYKVKEGQKVKQGDIIALVGSTGQSTGPHLHFELKKDGKHVDPEKYIK